MSATADLRIEAIRTLISPETLVAELPADERVTHLIENARRVVSDILNRRDDRLLVVVGPCSIHDVTSALDYARRLKTVADRLAKDLFIVMRVYFEKPRTTVGWKGLINDPRIDGSFAVNDGLRIARKLLLELARLGLPTGCEFLDTITPQYLADLVSWGAIGARTTESQVHRELASGLSVPVGFKNGTDGNIQIAIDAVSAAGHPHCFLGVTKQGLSAIVATRGNPDCHVILRGAGAGPNFQSPHVAKVSMALEKAGLVSRIMIDCSHGNSGRDPARQPAVARDVGLQIRAGSKAVAGIMVESHLIGGRQDPPTAGGKLVYGQSITDACLGWDDTVPLLEAAAEHVRTARAHR